MKKTNMAAAARLRLREVLEDRGMNQAELASAAGLAASTVNDYCGGKRGKRPRQTVSLDELGKLCCALGVGVAQLIEYDTGMLHVLKNKCNEVRIAIESRVRHRLHDRTDMEGLTRDMLDPWDVKSVIQLHAALAFARVGRRAAPARPSVYILDADQHIPANLLDCPPGTLTIMVGSPVMNPLVVPLLNRIGRESGLARPYSRVRMRLMYDADSDRPLDAASQASLVLVDRCDGERCRETGPTPGIRVPALGSQPETLLASTPRRALRTMGTHDDAAVILLCAEPFFIVVAGVGGPGTLAAATYLRKKLATLVGQIPCERNRLHAVALTVKVQKPTNGAVDDRQVLDQSQLGPLLTDILTEAP